MNTTEAADLARTILAGSAGERPADLVYTLTAREARTLAHAALAADRVGELAENLDAAALWTINLPDADVDLKAHAHADRGLATQIRAILNGDAA